MADAIEGELVIRGDTSQLGEDLDASEKRLEDFWKRLSSVMQNVADAIGGSTSRAVTNSLDAMNNTLSERLSSIEKSFQQTSEAIQKSTNSWTDWLVGWFVKLKVVGYLLAPFVWVFKTTFGLIADIISGFVKATIAILQGLLSTIGAIMKGLASVISSTLGAGFKVAFTVVSVAVKKITEVVGAFFSQMPLLLVDFSTGLKEGFKSLMDFEKIGVRLNALLKSTGELAGFSRRELDSMGKSLQKITGFTRDAAASAQAMLLRFFNIRGDIFEDATKTAADLATVLGTDLASAANDLGRALNNPIEGVKILRDMGLLLWDSEKALIESLVMTGRVAEAQRYLLDKLSQSIGGAAAEATKTFWGQITKANNALTDMWRTIADSLTPFLERLVPYIVEGAEKVTEWAENFKALAAEIIAWAESTQPVVTAWFQSMMDVAKEAFKAVVDFAVRAYTLFETAWADAPQALEAFASAAEIMAQKVKVFFMEMWEGHFDLLEFLWDKTANYAKKALLAALEPVAKTIDHLLNLASGGKMKFNPASFLIGFEKAAADIESENINKRREARSKEKREDSAAVQEERRKLEELERKGREMQKPFWDDFDKNLDKNQRGVQGFLDWTGQQLDKLTKPIKPGEVSERGNRGRPGVPFLIPASRTAGNFEALEALNKRIQSAAAKSPEIMLMQQQINQRNQHHSEQRRWSEEQVNATREAGRTIAQAASQTRSAVYS